MPKRYWGTMTEFQDESCFQAGAEALPEEESLPEHPESG